MRDGLTLSQDLEYPFISMMKLLLLFMFLPLCKISSRHIFTYPSAMLVYFRCERWEMTGTNPGDRLDIALAYQSSARGSDRVAPSARSTLPLSPTPTLMSYSDGY